jgi:hypothetical protein
MAKKTNDGKYYTVYYDVESKLRRKGHKKGGFKPAVAGS